MARASYLARREGPRRSRHAPGDAVGRTGAGHAAGADLKELQRHRFGRRAETLPEDQLLLSLEDVEQVEASRDAAIVATNTAERSNRAARRRKNRGSLPSHLPRVGMLVDVNDHACPGCHHALHRIGEDVSERLDLVPAQFRVLVVR